MQHDMTTEIVRALREDTQLALKEQGKMLRGKCPQCSKPELFISLEKPWQLKCGRESNCSYTESTKKRYAHLFENLSKRVPPSPQNPNATADAYISLKRGFDLELCRGMYRQEWKKNHATIRFTIKGDLWWERLIDEDGVRDSGAKAFFPFKSDPKDQGWMPPGQTLEAGDRVFITEGIFKALGLYHVKIGGKRLKVISAMSCNNLPREIITAHKGKGILWILANDVDSAGVKYARKFADDLMKMGEKVAVAFPEGGKLKTDWDDLYRAGRLDADYIAESLWRGYKELAETAQMQAFWSFARNPKMYHETFNFRGSVWSCKAKTAKDDTSRLDAEQLKESAPQLRKLWETPEMPGHAKEIAEFAGLFAKVFALVRISNCAPEFLYIEKDALTDKQAYHFAFDFMSGNPKQQVSFDGAVLESPSSWNKALLSQTPGGSFDGSQPDWKKMKEAWFDQRINFVTAIPYIGYAREFDAYVFPGFAYHGGRRLEVNDQDYLVCGKNQLKCSLGGVDIVSSDKFDGSWLSDFRRCFGFNGLTLMAWWLGTLFAEQIRTKQGSWPFLEFTGDKGAGKSNQIEFMWKLVGRNDRYEGFNPNAEGNTRVGRARVFQQFANLPVVLLEGDCGDKKARLDFAALKTFFNGRSIRSTGVAKSGSTTSEPPFRGAILISQNETVSGEGAVLERIVHCHVDKSLHTPELSPVAKELLARPASELCGWLHAVLSQADTLLESYLRDYATIMAKFTRKQGGVSSRIIGNHAQVAAWAWQLPKIFGQSFPADLCQQIEDFLWSRVHTRHAYIEGDSKFVSDFWDLYEDINDRMANSAVNHEQHRSLNHSCDPSVIAININEFLAKAQAYGFGNRLPSQRELKDGLVHSRSRKFIAEGKSVRSNRSTPGTPISTRAFLFRAPNAPDKE